MVIGFNANCLEKSSSRVKGALVKIRAVLAYTKPIINNRKLGRGWDVGLRSQLFHLLVRPLATAETPGAFLFGLRVMAADGTVLDVPDTPANAKVFGYPGSRHGTRAAFPKIRLVLLIEAGTHLIVDAGDVSLSHWRTSTGKETAAFSNVRDVINVG
jgi:hypothetical protein